MFNTDAPRFPRFDHEGLASTDATVPGTEEILVQYPHQTSTGWFRAVIWDRESMREVDAFDATRFTFAAEEAAACYPEARLSDAARAQLELEEEVAA